MGAPQARLSLLARAIARQGHEVYVLTAMPNYPGGKIHEGYSGVIRRETVDGVNVVRSWIFPTQSLGIVARLASYFSFVISALLAGLFTIPRVDFLITESPPLFLGITGYLLSHCKRARLVFNVSDLWPESAVRLGVVGPGVALSLASALEGFCYRKSWCVTGQSREIIGDVGGRFPGVRTYHLSNGVDPGLFRSVTRCPQRRAELAPGADIIAVYAGLHGIAQGLDQILDAAALLPKNSRLGIVLIGEGPEKQRLIRRASGLGLQNVRFLDPLKHKEMPAVLVSADIALITLKTTLPGAVPSKLYEAMAAGLPVVLAAGGEPADILRQCGAGIAVTAGDPRAMAEALDALAHDESLRARLSANGRRASEERFDRNVISGRFIRFLESEASSMPPAGVPAPSRS
jgi:glycosyltransferase involved in cell wall biosynthesis